LAMQWNVIAAEQGDPNAQVQYARNLLALKGAESGAEAILWLTRAANQGDPEAQYRLGEALYQGKFVGKDMVAAGQWILLAADSGYAEAKHLLKELQLFFSNDQLAQAKKRAKDFKPVKE